MDMLNDVRDDWDSKNLHIAELEELVSLMKLRIRLMKKKMRLLEKSLKQSQQVIDLLAG